MLEWFWRLLPDKCECVGCERFGVRGNENRVGGRLVCDYCYTKNEHLMFKRRWWDRLRGIDTSDITEATEEWFRNAKLRMPDDKDHCS